MNKFQQTLKELLSSKGINRKQLAERIDISTSALNGYFNENLYPTSDILIKMSDFFEVSINYLLGFEDVELKNTNRAFIENYNTLLKDKNISIAKSLRDMNMGNKNYSVWKKGKIPKTYNLIAIAEYFDVSVDYLLGRSEY